LALGLVNFITTLSPQRIIMGGGVMHQVQLYPLIHQEVQALLNGYVKSPAILDQIETYIVPPGLGSLAGVLGAIALAEEAHQASSAGGRKPCVPTTFSI
jgi:fructokinase